MLTQAEERFGLDANTPADPIREDLRERSFCHRSVKVKTHTLFPASNFVAVVELFHVQLSATCSTTFYSYSFYSIINNEYNACKENERNLSS